MRKKVPFISDEDRMMMRHADAEIDHTEWLSHGTGEGYSKIVGGVYHGASSRPTKTKDA